jgi:hypothetical protein
VAAGRHKSDGPFDSNLQASLAIGQSWIILCEKLLGELGENLGLSVLWEEVGEDALQRIPRGSQAFARQVSTPDF